MALSLSADGTNDKGIHTLRELEVFLQTCRQLGMPDETEIAAKVKWLFISAHGPMHNITASWPGAAASPSNPAAIPSPLLTPPVQAERKSFIPSTPAAQTTLAESTLVPGMTDATDQMPPVDPAAPPPQ